MKRRLGVGILAVVLATCGGAAVDAPAEAAKARKGPLRPFKANPRYFTDGSGRAVYLTGSHVWWNLVGDKTWKADCHLGSAYPWTFSRYLDRLQEYGHNFIRLWTIEQTSWHECGQNIRVGPHPWARTGPANAQDGLPKFDLTRWNPAYFRRLRNRVAAASRRNMYVAVMLFEGFGLMFLDRAWANHPLNGANNVNGVHGDPNGDGKGLEVHTLANRRVTAVQERYVRKVVDTVNGFDNVLYEIANEPGARSVPWQNHMIRVVRSHQARKRKQHPVGMTLAAPDGWNEQLLESNADWISPGGYFYAQDPPAANRRKVSILDTDHVCQICGGWDVVWKNFTRGHNVILMDPQDSHPLRVTARWAMGHSRRYANRMNLARARPYPDLASSRYCLADPKREFLVYQPTAGSVTVDLRRAPGRLAGEWLNPLTGKTSRTSVTGGAHRTLKPPFDGASVLYLRRR